MVTVELSVSELTRHLAERYATLGRPRALTPLSFSFPVSNRLFCYTTSHGRFVLKVITHPASLYGQADVVERLETVGRALADLQRGGLPVEQIVRGDAGRYVEQYEGYLIRLYLFDPGRPFSGGPEDMMRSARALRCLHAEALSSLDAETRRDLLTLQKAYPLHATAPELSNLRRFVDGRANASPTYATILDHWQTIEWAVERALAPDLLEPDSLCVVHTDFHPRNALLHDDRDAATMIDFDNMLIERRLTCLGFTILRFAFFERHRTPAALHEAVSLFAGEEVVSPHFMERLTRAMIFIEAEKVLRILHRVKTTGQYAAFVKNICPLHIANLNLLRAGVLGE